MQLPQRRLTVCVSGGGADVDSAWEQKKLAARKMPVNRAESPPSTARFVSRAYVHGSSMLKAEGNSYAMMIQKSRISQKRIRGTVQLSSQFP